MKQDWINVLSTNGWYEERKKKRKGPSIIYLWCTCTRRRKKRLSSLYVFFSLLSIFISYSFFRGPFRFLKKRSTTVKGIKIILFFYHQIYTLPFLLLVVVCSLLLLLLNDDQWSLFIFRKRIRRTVLLTHHQANPGMSNTHKYTHSSRDARIHIHTKVNGIETNPHV